MNLLVTHTQRWRLTRSIHVLRRSSRWDIEHRLNHWTWSDRREFGCLGNNWPPKP